MTAASIGQEAFQKFTSRIKNFQGLRAGRDRHRTVIGPDQFTVKEALDYVYSTGMNSECYITGRLVSLEDPTSYTIDHIVPVFRGGTCSLQNLGITTPIANLSKVHMTPYEYYEMYADALSMQGYTIIGTVNGDHNRLEPWRSKWLLT